MGGFFFSLLPPCNQVCHRAEGGGLLTDLTEEQKPRSCNLMPSGPPCSMLVIWPSTTVQPSFCLQVQVQVRKVGRNGQAGGPASQAKGRLSLVVPMPIIAMFMCPQLSMGLFPLPLPCQISMLPLRRLPRGSRIKPDTGFVFSKTSAVNLVGDSTRR